jgi:hypothetical protein
MFTGILAVVIGLVGLGLTIAGVWSGLVLIAEKADSPVTLRYYAIPIGITGIGVGLLGIAQGLRILLLILHRVATVPSL